MYAQVTVVDCTSWLQDYTSGDSLKDRKQVGLRLLVFFARLPHALLFAASIGVCHDDLNHPACVL